MTSKERAALKRQAIKLESIFQVGKMGITPQTVDALRNALKARELIKINVLKNCDDEIPALARTLSERTSAEIVQVIGRKIVLYKKNPQKEEKKKTVVKREVVKKGLRKVKVKDDSTEKRAGKRPNRGNNEFKGKILKTKKSRRKV